MVIERQGKEMDLDSFCITTVRMERVLYRWFVFSMPSKSFPESKERLGVLVVEKI